MKQHEKYLEILKKFDDFVTIKEWAIKFNEIYPRNIEEDNTIKIRKIEKTFKKARDKIFTFLLYPNIPPDNNGSERAIRNLKVKLKVSQQFKSPQGAKEEKRETNI